jgi:hypothetical protein
VLFRGKKERKKDRKKERKKERKSEGGKVCDKMHYTKTLSLS